MKKLITLIALSTTAFLTACASTATPDSIPAPATDAAAHAEHHPATATAPATSASAPAAASAMEDRMKNMQAMRDKIMNAKTPAERQALMDEHMKTMHEGMAMMKGMQGMQGMGGMSGMKDMPMKDMAKHHQMMEMRMEMMQTMMEMMMQRMPGAAMPPAGK
ncbi:MAG: hypothetical protein Q7J53_01720 [Hydrogenophaga sp.]|nr:hypothetical protein [Hydrogenophaga sp.]MDO9603279.1 hypothetical protein [Hydrogenophaga sp.]